ncbi:MAG: tripartite tricarboxylate transporter substrate binding protein [Pseudomonadota bacterium]
MFKRQFLQAAAATFAVPLAATPFAAFAAEVYPSRPIKLVVTFPPGGASDLMARIFGLKFGEAIGQTVIIDNHPGAAGALGTEYTAHQPADGYTFMIGNMGPTIVNPLITKVPYDMAKDFTPVSLIATGPVVMVVNGNSPYKTLKEFIAGAKAKAGGFNFGSGGAGTLAHLTGEMMNRSAGLNMQHVPYKGGIQALNDVLAGQLDMLAADVQPVVQHIRSGKLRALAVSSPQRFALLPDVPTYVESGMPDIVALNSWGVFLPAGVPKADQAVFRKALDKAMVDPELVKKFAELGVDALHTSAPELLKFNDAERAKYGKLIKEKNIKAE